MEYKVYLTTKIKASTLNAGAGIIVIEPEDYTITEIKAIKKKGYRLLAYLSAGTLEKNRLWYNEFRKQRLKQLADWHDEWYMDIRNESWREHILKIAKTYKNMGFDGWWIDNIDVYSEYKSKEMFEAIKSLLFELRNTNSYVMINGGSEWIDDAIDHNIKLTQHFNGYTQEEVFSRITDYSGKGKFGKQESDDSKYYQNLIKKVTKVGVACFCLEYTKNNDIKETIKKWCKKYKINYYISNDVNL